MNKISSDSNASNQSTVQNYASTTPEARIGHVHLKVADIKRSVAFYCGVLGFKVTQYLSPQLVLISAGGNYHHHIALNSRQSMGGSPPPDTCTGLDHFAILYPTRAGLKDALHRLIVANIGFEKAADYGISESVHVRDPDGNGVELTWDRPMDAWPRTATGNLAAGAQELDFDELLTVTE